MKDQSIRKLTDVECDLLCEVMGFTEGALDEYIGRFTKIRLVSPKRVDSWDGARVYVNENKGRAP